MRDWLLTIEAGGRALRYSSIAREVAGLMYSPGLVTDGLTVAPGLLEDVTLEVVSSTLWAVRTELDAGTATLALLDGESVSEFSFGPITGPGFGAVDEPISVTITRTIPGFEVRGLRIPDTTSRVDEATWPDALPSAEIGNEGVFYPVIFGYPGQTEAALPTPCVPVPVAQVIAGDTSNSLVIVSEDSDTIISTVYLRHQNADAEFTQAVLPTIDNLGKRVLAATCTAGGLPSIPTTSSSILAGYTESTGGGPVREMYESIAYLLRRWGGTSVDWSRLPSIRRALEGYLVDSWVNAPTEDPWVLVQHWLTHLPVTVRTSAVGNYFVEERLTHDPAFVVGRLAAPDTGQRTSDVIRDGAPVNEVTVLYRQDPEAGWSAQATLCGSKREILPSGTESAVYSTVLEHSAARRSYAKYNRRAGPSITVDWTWDTGTALAVGGAVLARNALPALLVSYDVHPSVVRGWEEGAEVLLTDPEMGWVDKPAIISAPPTHGLESVSVSLRLPEL